MKVTGKISQLKIDGEIIRNPVIGNVSQLNIETHISQIPVIGNVTQLNVKGEICQTMITADISQLKTKGEISQMSVESNISQIGARGQISQIPVRGIVSQLNINGSIEESGVSYPAVLEDGDTVFFYDPSDLFTITKDGGNIITRWNDKLGSGRDLVIGSALWVDPGTVRFNGVDQYLATNYFAWPVPVFVYIILKQITWTNVRFILSPNSNDMYVYQFTPTPNIALYSGTRLNSNPDIAVGEWGILRALFNGANSKLITNDNAPVISDAGATNDGGGFWIGRRPSLTAPGYSNIEVEAIIGRKSTVGEADIYNYLVTRKPA